MSAVNFQWSSSFSRASKPLECVDQCVGKLELSALPHVIFFFVSNAFAAQYSEVLELLAKRFPKAHLIGCSAGGLVGRGVETEFRPGLSLLAGVLPGVSVETFHLEELPDLDGPPQAWRDAVSSQGAEVKGMVILGDPFSLDTRSALAGLDFAFPKAAKVGGLASGCHQPGEAALFLGRSIHREGVVGMAFSGEIELIPVVAQGCQGFGRQYVITESQANIVLELDGQPALKALEETIGGLTQEERAVYLGTTIFVGLGAGGPSLSYGEGEFLVRQVLGTDLRVGAIAVGGAVRNGQTLQFHLRSSETSKADLTKVLRRAKERLHGSPQGALMFSCLGRGEGLYGVSGHDSRLFKEEIGDIPVSGFFCNGEFGPVGEETCLHGFTTSFAVFCQPVSTA